jgi:hypothetical protein
VDQLAAQHQRELDALVRRLTGVRNDLLAAQQEELEVFSRKFQVRCVLGGEGRGVAGQCGS